MDILCRQPENDYRVDENICYILNLLVKRYLRYILNKIFIKIFILHTASPKSLVVQAFQPELLKMYKHAA